MIDEALFASYPDRRVSIVEFFQKGTRRVAALRTETSCTFHYRGTGQKMNRAVIEEVERLELANKEREILFGLHKQEEQQHAQSQHRLKNGRLIGGKYKYNRRQGQFKKKVERDRLTGSTVPKLIDGMVIDSSEIALESATARQPRHEGRGRWLVVTGHYHRRRR